LLQLFVLVFGFLSLLFSLFFFLILRPPPCSPLFPYTTLFRSLRSLQPVGSDQGVPLARHVLNVRVRAAYADPVRDLLGGGRVKRSEEHTSELQSRENLVCRLLLEKKKKKKKHKTK